MYTTGGGKGASKIFSKILTTKIKSVKALRKTQVKQSNKKQAKKMNEPQAKELNKP